LTNSASLINESAMLSLLCRVNSPSLTPHQFESHPTPTTHLTDSQKVVMARLMAKIEESHKQQDVLAQELSAKFAALDMDNLLTPAALTTANGIIRSRATIQRFSELIEERRRLAVSFLDEGERTLRSSGLDRVILQTELEAASTTKNRNLALIGDLENAQRGIVISVLKIIDLCEHSLGRLGVRDGGILFQSQEQVDTYQTQLGLIQQYAQREDIAMAAFIAFSKQTRQR
ncbi:MAG: hypothetical protein ACYC2E_11120, partial [Sulfuricella sp.]